MNMNIETIEDTTRYTAPPDPYEEDSYEDDGRDPDYEYDCWKESQMEEEEE